ERGAQYLFQPALDCQRALPRRGRCRLAHRPRRGVRHPGRAGRDLRDQSEPGGRPAAPLELHQRPAGAPLPRRDRLRPLPAHAVLARRLRAHHRPAPAAQPVALPSGWRRQWCGSRLVCCSAAAFLPSMSPPRLFLLDGYALIYRAFFAMISRPLRTTRGENTSAAWGVANFLLRLAEKHRLEYLVWVNDAGTSFREERYPEYKSSREKLDDELQADFDRSLERILELLAAFRIPTVAVPGYEADDVIGTLAVRAADAGLQAVIVSGDKDFHQLVGPGVALLNPGRGGPAAVEETWVDESNASDRLGVPPGQVVDFLALVGDTSDNVPGVKGIGEKGAQKLLAEYGDLEAILAHAADVTAKRTREALLAQADNARLSRELVTIHRDVPVEMELEALRAAEPDYQALVRISNELEFASLARRFAQAGQGSEAAAIPLAPGVAAPADAVVAGVPPDPTGHVLEVSVLCELAELPAVIERLRTAPLVALDTETTSLSP